jgi:RNA polymerase sigma-70 factor (ECF subfamily)
LLIRVRDADNAEAWRDFDAIYRPMLVRFARSRGLGEAEADDVVQHCFTSIQQHIRSFDYDPRKGRFKGWLRTLVNNRVRSTLRKRRDEQAQTHHFNQVEGREDDPEVAFERIWMDAHLKYALRQVQSEVNAETFAAFVKYVVEEQTVEEVCDEFSLTPNNLYKIKWRLTSKLNEKMNMLLDGDE